MVLTYIGTIIVVVGVFLPWISASVSGAMMNIGAQTATGFELNQGLVGGGIALVSGVLGFLGSREVVPRRLIGFLIIIASIVIVMVSGGIIMDPGGGTVSSGPISVTANVSLEPGVFVTAIGGIILFISGLIALFVSD